MSLRILFVLAIALSAAFAASCGGGGDSESAPPVEGYALIGPSREGSLIIADAGGLTEFSIESGESKPLVEIPEANTFILDPALSPEAKQLAYIFQPPAQVVNGRFDAGTDIWIANRDGTNARVLYEHELPNQLVRYPRWLDESTLFAIIQSLEERGGITRVIYTLQRIDVPTGEREIVLEDVLAFDISPDRTRIVYAKIEPTSGETLHGVDVDGSGNDVELVPVSENLAPFNSPDFGPGSDRIAFAAADQTMSLPSGQRLVTTGPLATPPLDGLPQDIWMIDAEGSRPQLVADLKEDIPALTWGGDGEYIYVLGVNALYEINLENGAVDHIGPGVFHGQIVWAPGD